jgi:hypothetical protein
VTAARSEPNARAYALSAESFTPIGVWGGTTTIERAEEILNATHDERLERWRGFAQEAIEERKLHGACRLARPRVTEPLRAAALEAEAV